MKSLHAYSLLCMNIPILVGIKKRGNMPRFIIFLNFCKIYFSSRRYARKKNGKCPRNTRRNRDPQTLPLITDVFALYPRSTTRRSCVSFLHFVISSGVRAFCTICVGLFASATESGSSQDRISYPRLHVMYSSSEMMPRSMSVYPTVP